MDVSFSLGGMLFEYDENKNQTNIRKHGIPFKMAARVFLDYYRIELYDEENSDDEDRYDTVGNIGVNLHEYVADEGLLFVVYTERKRRAGKIVTRLISARKANSFERGMYYGKYGNY